MAATTTTTTRIAAGAAVLAMSALLGACSAKVETTKSISAADLQKKLTDQFAASKNPPKSVTCKDDLVAEVGKTSSCAVELSATDTVQAVVTVTSISGSDLQYDIMPSYTKEELAKGVSGMLPDSTVTCATGLEGKIGATAQCDVTRDGVASKRVLSVDGVSGLQMDLSMRRLWPKEKVQEVLMQRLNADGTPAETVECVDGVMGKTGQNVECVAVTGSQKKGYVVTVTTVEEDDFGIDYKDVP